MLALLIYQMFAFVAAGRFVPHPFSVDGLRGGAVPSPSAQREAGHLGSRFLFTLVVVHALPFAPSIFFTFHTSVIPTGAGLLVLRPLSSLSGTLFVSYPLPEGLHALCGIPWARGEALA